MQGTVRDMGAKRSSAAGQPEAQPGDATPHGCNSFDPGVAPPPAMHLPRDCPHQRPRHIKYVQQPGHVVVVHDESRRGRIVHLAFQRIQHPS